MEALMMLALTLGALPQAPVPPQAPPTAHPVCEICSYDCTCLNCGCGVRRSLPENPIVTYRWVYPAQVTTQGTLFQPARAVAPQPQFYFTPQPAPQPVRQRPSFQFYPPAQQQPAPSYYAPPTRQPTILRQVAAPVRAAVGGC